MLVRTSARGAIRALILLSMLFALGCASSGSSESKADLTRRAQSGDVEAQYQLGLEFADSMLPGGAKAIYWLCRAAKGGHVPAQLALAALYEKSGEEGGGSAQGGRLSNKGSAYFWYTAAASQGSDEALAARDALAATMDPAEVLEVKRRATRWQQSVCVEPAGGGA